MLADRLALPHAKPLSMAKAGIAQKKLGDTAEACKKPHVSHEYHHEGPICARINPLQAVSSEIAAKKWEPAARQKRKLHMQRPHTRRSGPAHMCWRRKTGSVDSV